MFRMQIEGFHNKLFHGFPYFAKISSLYKLRDMYQFTINQHQPELADDVYIAPGAMVMGKVRMAEK